MDLHDKLSYDPETGDLRWKNCRSNIRQNGALAGCTRKDGYKVVRLGNTLFLVHRVIWRMMTGEWPGKFIDHIDHDKGNNRWNNLRAADYRENRRNVPAKASNTSGIPGVRRADAENRWCASIWDDVKQVRLYSGPDFFEACCRRKSAENRLGYHPNHGTRLA